MRRLGFLISLAVLAAFAGTSAEEPEPGAPLFLPDYESAFVALGEAKGGLAVPIQNPGEIKLAAIGPVELGPQGLSLKHESGAVFVELRKVRRMRTWPPVYNSTYPRLFIEFLDDRPSVELWARSDSTARQAENALSTLVAAAGGHLFEAAGFSSTGPSLQEKQKKMFGGAKADLAYGIVINEPAKDTPAARAGFKGGDILMIVKDVPVWEGIEVRKDEDGDIIAGDLSALPTGDVSRDNVRLTEAGGSSQLHEALQRCLLSSASGRASVTIEVVTGTSAQWARTSRTLLIRDLARLYQGPRLPRFTLGMFALPLGEEDRARLGLAEVEGLLVTEITKGGLAERLKLRVDDVLVEINGRPVRTTGELAGALAEFDKLESAKVYRGGAPVILTMPRGF